MSLAVAKACLYTRRNGVKIPNPDVGRYTTETTTVGSDTFLIDQSDNGNDLLIVAGGVVDGKLTPDTVLRMPSAYWDKSDTGTWVTGNFFYYDSGNPRDWRVDELHYRLIDEVFGVNPTHRTFGRQMWADEVFEGLTELVLYSTKQTQLRTLRNYIGIKDFQNQGNYYYNGEWTIRPYLQFIVEGTTFDMELGSSSSDTAYWGDGTSDTVTARADYAHTWTYGGKHIVSVTDRLVRFNISACGLIGNIEYWRPSLDNWTNIVIFQIYSNQFTGDLSSWASALVNLTNITHFYINNNNFTGDLSVWASALVNWNDIIYFYINNNQFTGDLSVWASALVNWNDIIYFYINNNQFTGDLSGWAIVLANWTKIVNFLIYSNQFSYIVAPEQSRGAGYLLQNNLALVDNINALLEGQYNYYLANTPERDLTINISGMPVPTYDYAPLSTLFTNAGHVLTVITD